MRKLLSLLTVLTLTVPVPLNVIACGNKANPAPDVDETDYLALKQIAQEKIQIEFANLVSKGLNLRTVGDLTEGNKIMAYLNQIGQKTDTVITTKDSKVTVEGFLEILKAQVLTISNNLVDKYPELKPLFNGVNPNERLKIDTDKLDSLLTNKVFNWESENFGIANFDAKKQYGVTDWYYLSANLNLELTCLDENAKINTFHIPQLSYNMYFANNDSKLEKIVSVVSEKVSASLINYLVKINSGKQFNLSKYDRDSDLKNDILADLNGKISNPKVKIINSNFLTTDSNNVMTGRKLAMKHGIFDNDKTKAISLLKDGLFMSKGMNYYNQNFETYLNSWQFKSSIDKNDLPNVSLASQYQINDWNYDNLALLPIAIPTVVVEKQTRMAKIDAAANKYGTIFASDGILKDKLFTDDRYQNFMLTMNKTDFKNYKDSDKTFGNVVEYANDKIKKYAISQNVLNNDDFFRAYNSLADTDKSNTQFTNQILNKHLKGNDFYIHVDPLVFNFKLDINGYEFETWSRLLITIKQGDNDSIWPA